MTEPIERFGENGLRITLDFPDAARRDAFERAFRDWLEARPHGGAEDDDVAGHLFRHGGPEATWRESFFSPPTTVDTSVMKPTEPTD